MQCASNIYPSPPPRDGADARPRDGRYINHNRAEMSNCGRETLTFLSSRGHCMHIILHRIYYYVRAARVVVFQAVRVRLSKRADNPERVGLGADSFCTDEPILSAYYCNIYVVYVVYTRAQTYSYAYNIIVV